MPKKPTQLNLAFNLQEKPLFIIFLGFFNVKNFFKCLCFYIYISTPKTSHYYMWHLIFRKCFIFNHLGFFQLKIFLQMSLFSCIYFLPKKQHKIKCGI